METKQRTQFIITCITRWPLTSNQLVLFKALYEAGDEHWISISELAYRMNEAELQSVIGVLGALGKRVNDTEGVDSPYDGIGLMMCLDRFHDEEHYCISPELCAVINNFPVLQNALNLSVDQITTQFGEDGLVV